MPVGKMLPLYVKIMRMRTQADVVLDFLREVAAHNDRAWFARHRDDYEQARTVFEEMTQQLILRIASFDETVRHVQVKDCTYRFYRDTRFSEDKAPYKRHFGAYVNARGKKSYHSGYYLHLQPGACMLAGGSWCLPPDILRAVRQSVVDELEEFRSIVEAPDFRRHFPVIGEQRVKTIPKGFPRDFAHPEYLRPKDYSVACGVSDDFFRHEDWVERAGEIFHLMKPFNDFVNYTIDDLI